MRDGELALRPGAGVPEKIRREHRDRLAIVYIRQSTMQQVERHQESTRLQYALTARAYSLGWAREMIVVIDDDLGRSGATIAGRVGFQRLVAEVGFGHVGPSTSSGGARRRDGASGALMPGLAPIARDRRPV